MMGLARLPSLVVWGLAVMPAAGLHPFRNPLMGNNKLLAEKVEEVALDRPVKVFTLFDARFRRIAKVWRDCLLKAIPHPISMMSVEAREVASKALMMLQTGRQPPTFGVNQETIRKNVSLLQTESRLPTGLFSHLLVNEWASKLSSADTLHIDADAFLLRDPLRATVVQHPQADIIAEVDCVYSKPRCSWYRRQEYLDRNRGQDPLQEQGFMLNTGFMYLRSLPATVELLNRVSSLTRQGENEQVAVNEVLLNWGCNWTLPDGSPAPWGPAAQEYLEHSVLQGTCSSGSDSLDKSLPSLSVVVLPRSAVQRLLPVKPDSVAYHPGGRIEDKERILGVVRRMCNSKRI